MAMQLGGEDDDLAEAHEINVTPFIDVMLVLLIIFMVAAPLATVDVPVNMPSAAAVPQPRPDKPVFLTLRADRALHLGEAAVEREALAAALETAFEGDREGRVFIRADGTIPYAEVMEVLNLLRGAGWTRVALVGLEQR
ncbi:TonB system transport protein ExbD [Sabulicella glaciei]|uniref:Biopolymer transport protein ExbD n=1 Tax=Sabulicella glaciei TaxID=2984948 RepID=A0ABT3P0R2_9PROT|nr:TonB system transport protein ExbD [Roseococcus sp. MDT2-1-1]MCW8087997.1 TonB system transport protein ExbD [Roseococcus sp. MDT2-1-1]